MKQKRLTLALLSVSLIMCSVAISATFMKRDKIESKFHGYDVQAYWDNSDTIVINKKLEMFERNLQAIQIQETPAMPAQQVALSRGSEGITITPRKTSSTKQSTSYKKSSYTAPKPSGTLASSKYSAGEIDLFSRLVSAESTGESYEGKLAVATVIINRVNSPSYPNTIKGVIYDDNYGIQFTPVADGRINLPASSDAKKAVLAVLNGYRSFGPSILYFMNPKTAVSSWIAQNKTFYKTIGNHNFYY